MRIIIAVTICSVFYFHSVRAENMNIWKEISTANKTATADSSVIRRLYRADNQYLTQILSRADMEGRSRPSSRIELPVANGEIQLFSVEESPIMAAGLAAKYPSIKTYKIRGIDDPASSGRLSMSSKGLNGMITGPSGSYFIDAQRDGVYSAYRKNKQQNDEPFHCGVSGHNHDNPLGYDVASRPAYRTPGSLRVYRLAVAATSEYISRVGGTTQAAGEEIVKTINRVNQVYERDLGIRLVLVGNNDLLMETGSNLPVAYTNDNVLSMLGENQQNIDAVIGTENYDIGHVFGTRDGGIAEVGSVCNENNKAGGATGLLNPTGDAFYIDYVAHEIGHQFSAEHSFNGTTRSCSVPNRWQASAFEPGGGSTIMSYAGICGSENITEHADAMFHAGSIAQIDTFTTSGAGASCGDPLSINNPSEPAVNAGNDYTIPRKTPFILNASGSDNDGDAITYTWDQMDAGTATNGLTLGTDLGSNALFRSYLPRPENYRHFPALGTTLQNKFDKSENLACLSRSLNFQVTTRDGHSGIGRDNVKITVDNGSGPFQILSFNESQTLTGGQQYDIEWDPANTSNSPVNCSAVDISLLSFNSANSIKTSYFETSLAVNESNDGLATVNMPDISSSQARFMVKCSDNIFYDISDADLNITGTTTISTTGESVYYNSSGLLITDTPTEICTTKEDKNAEDDSSGGGSFSLYWLFCLFLTLPFHKRLSCRAM